jgi:hypothetical protein
MRAWYLILFRVMGGNPDNHPDNHPDTQWGFGDAASNSCEF